MKTKKEIIENLIRREIIGLDEAIILLETEKEVVYIPSKQPLPYTHPITPYYDKILHTPPKGVDSPFLEYTTASVINTNPLPLSTVTQKTDVPTTKTSSFVTKKQDK